ncbi:RmlC-like cupin [Meredithblackwellia eburnea MCA 4105]
MQPTGDDIVHVSSFHLPGSKSVQRGPPNFTGTVFLDSVFPKQTQPNFHMSTVTFTPGSRSVWHSHTEGQILVVTAGSGWVQADGKPPKRLRVGDVCFNPPNVRHWHGADDDTLMTHTTVSFGTTDWFEPVSEEDYGAKTKQVVTSDQVAS